MLRAVAPGAARATARQAQMTHAVHRARRAVSVDLRAARSSPSRMAARSLSEALPSPTANSDGNTSASGVPVPVVLVVVALLLGVILLCANVLCVRYRGIGLCRALSMCPGRVMGEATAMMTVHENEVARRDPSFELGKWRPWRPEPVA